jgi:MFS family permease
MMSKKNDFFIFTGKCFKNSDFETFSNIIVLYAAHTSPLYFATFAMPTILRAQKTSLTLIGLFGYLMIPWTLKFLWAPWIDRYYKSSWGKRKTWIVPAQFCLVLLLSSLLFLDPGQHAILLFFLLLGISFFAATQDIASGAYVIEQLTPERRQFGNYAQVIGTTLGSASGGAFILYCYGQLGWKISVICILSLSFFFLIALCKMRETQQSEFIQRKLPSLTHFWKRLNTRYLLYLCFIYRSCEGFIMGMQQPFLVDQQIPVSTIGLVMGVGNITLGLVGAGLAGFLFKPLGGFRLLILLGGLRSLAYFGLFAVAFFDLHSQELIFTIVIVNMATRLMEMVMLYTVFMNQCSSQQAATDFSI